MEPSTTRRWRPAWPCPVGQVLAPLRHGQNDPTYRVIDGVHHRGIRTPEGVALISIEARNSIGEVVGTASGPGAGWALDQMPRQLGAEDDVSGFAPPEVLRHVWRRAGNWRFGASGLVMESLVPAIIEQKVTGQEAFLGYRNLVERYGEPAPGVGSDLGVWVPPDAGQLGQIPSWEWLRMPIDGARSKAVRAAARVASSLERASQESTEVFDRRLRSIAGIGVWTSAEVRQRALGDADAVSFGDYHIAKDVTWAMTGEQGDDARMAELLEAYRPHRARIPVLVAMARLRRPRRGPRMAPRQHLPTPPRFGR